ncbi:MAG TPA: hypothetical protein GX745_06500 [Clostridiales bacterium]|nr:hypothetical protein [Clostridiales bacterium]
MKDDQDFLEFDEDDYLNKLYEQDPSGDIFASDNVIDESIHTAEGRAEDENKAEFLQAMTDTTDDTPEKTQAESLQATSDITEDNAKQNLEAMANIQDDAPNDDAPDQAQITLAAAMAEQPTQEQETENQTRTSSEKMACMPKKIKASQK